MRFQFIGLVMLFMIALIFGFIGNGFINSQPAPTNETALNQYNNLSETTEVSFTAMTGVYYFILLAGFLAAILLIGRSIS